MKRYLILCVLLIFLIPCMVVPASATTQGVIDAIEDQTDSLGEWLGVGLGDIRDWCESIYDSVVDTYQLIDGYIGANLDFIATEFANLVGNTFPSWTNYFKGIYGYFFTTNQKTTYYRLNYSSTGVSLVIDAANVSVTGFQRDLSSIHFDLLNGLFRVLDGMTDLLRGDTSASDKFDEDMTPIETEVDEWIDSMETAPTINVDDIETEVDKVTDFETDANYLSILSGIFLDEAFLMMFTWCVILAMLGFILYGKR